jgi:hypothetical protein
MENSALFSTPNVHVLEGRCLHEIGSHIHETRVLHHAQQTCRGGGGGGGREGGREEREGRE